MIYVLFFGNPVAGRFFLKAFLAWIALILFFAAPSKAAIFESEVLILVNQNSPTSIYAADLYRLYHPAIQDHQIVFLTGLSDCAGLNGSPQNELISRADFESLIAEPVRQHLLDHNLVNPIKVILTTAGIPYRITDSLFPNLVRPAASTPYGSNDVYQITAASVESELTVLWQIDPAGSNPMPRSNRMVNPYHGYRSSGIDLFARDILARRNAMQWKYPLRASLTHIRPWMEGNRNEEGMKDRLFAPGDFYLTCRLDVPRKQGKLSIFAIHDLLERARRASDPAWGVNPAQAILVLDDAPNASEYNCNRNHNLEQDTPWLIYQPGEKQPPDTTFRELRDDYANAFYWIAGTDSIPLTCNTANAPAFHYMRMILDDRPNYPFTKLDLQNGQLVVSFAAFGCNGDEARTPDYLCASDPLTTAIFPLAYGAVFTSIESYNAVTFFSDSPAIQAKIADFLAIGGSAAIGHAFEPLCDAIPSNEFFLFNLFADTDLDFRADLTFIEAAFSALPYLSWSEVVIGDPLMQIAYGPGGTAPVARTTADTNYDNQITSEDFLHIGLHYGGIFGQNSLYDDLADVNQDGLVNTSDILLVRNNLPPPAASPRIRTVTK